MKIVWFSWKDIKNPLAGGAEVIGDMIAKNLVKDGHEIIILTSHFDKAKPKEIMNGYTVIRVGNRFTVYIAAAIYFLQHLRNWPELIIEEINTVPFFTFLYSKQKRVLLIYQLCREIWFYQLPLPISLIGYILEPLYLWFFRNHTILTESQSTKSDLLNYGFKKEKIFVFPICIDIKPLKQIEEKKTNTQFTVLSLGAIRNMKRTLDQIKAFEVARKEVPQLKMIVAGKSIGDYGQKVIRYIQSSPYKRDIEYVGEVSKEKKVDLMQKSHVILVTSVKEGWGLIITEAASQGTPAIVYDIDGLRDAVINNESGIICQPDNSPKQLATELISLVQNNMLYKKLQHKSLDFSRTFEEKKTYKAFTEVLFRK